MEHPGSALRILVLGFGIAPLVCARRVAVAGRRRKSPTSSTSVGIPSMVLGKTWPLLKSDFENFILTSSFTASVPVGLPSLIFSPIPTPIVFSHGAGLTAVVNGKGATARNAASRIAASSWGAWMNLLAKCFFA